MRDFDLVDGGTYRTRNGLIVTLSECSYSDYLQSEYGFDYDPNDKEEGHLAFDGETHDLDLVERIS